MLPNQGRLQTGEHILARIIQDRVKDARVVIARFDDEDEGSVDFSSQSDLRGIDLGDIEREVNYVIRRDLPVIETIRPREGLEGFDISKIPPAIDKIRIIEIKGFDARPCKDPHVSNTVEIGYFSIRKVERVGKDRYRFVFFIKNEGHIN